METDKTSKLLSKAAVQAVLIFVVIAVIVMGIARVQKLTSERNLHRYTVELNEIMKDDMIRNVSKKLEEKRPAKDFSCAELQHYFDNPKIYVYIQKLKNYINIEKRILIGGESVVDH